MSQFKHSVGIIVGISMGESPDSIRVVGEADLLDLSRVARSTWQNWIKQGAVSDPRRGHYGEAEVVGLVVASRIVDAIGLHKAALAWPRACAATVESALAMPLDGSARLDLVIDLFGLEIAAIETAEALDLALHPEVATPRVFAVIAAGKAIREARGAFWNRAVPPATLRQDRRRRAAMPAHSGRAPSPA